MERMDCSKQSARARYAEQAVGLTYQQVNVPSETDM